MGQRISRGQCNSIADPAEPPSLAAHPNDIENETWRRGYLKGKSGCRWGPWAPVLPNDMVCGPCPEREPPPPPPPPPPPRPPREPLPPPRRSMADSTWSWVPSNSTSLSSFSALWKTWKKERKHSHKAFDTVRHFVSQKLTRSRRITGNATETSSQSPGATFKRSEPLDFGGKKMAKTLKCWQEAEVKQLPARKSKWTARQTQITGLSFSY